MRDRAEDQREQQQHEGDVEAGEDGGVGLGEGGEQRPAEGDQPDLVAVPDRADGVDEDAPLVVGRGASGWRMPTPRSKPSRMA